MLTEKRFLTFPAQVVFVDFRDSAAATETDIHVCRLQTNIKQGINKSRGGRKDEQEPWRKEG